MLNAGVVFGYASLNYVLNSLHRGGCVSGIFSFYFYLAVSSSRFSKFLFPWQLVVETPVLEAQNHLILMLVSPDF